jgi:hypothetical protein
MNTTTTKPDVKKVEEDPADVAVAWLSPAGLIGMLAVIGVWVLPAMLLRGFVLNQLWVWFAESAGLPHIGVSRAVGVSMLIMMLRGASKTDKEKISGNEFMISFLFPLVVLGLGYIFSRFL